MANYCHKRNYHRHISLSLVIHRYARDIRKDEHTHYLTILTDTEQERGIIRVTGRCVILQVTPREVLVDAGGRLELRCHVSGDPVDTVTWYKDGVTLR